MSELDVYKLTSEWTNAGGGTCEWAFGIATAGRHKDQSVFIKRFLTPKYPLSDSPGSHAAKAQRKIIADEFDTRHREMTRRLKVLGGTGGALVLPLEFFRDGTTFFKVSPKVDVNYSISDLCAAPIEHRISSVLLMAQAVNTLHSAGMVHGDLKPDNILFFNEANKPPRVRVIDFDDCYVPEEIPHPNAIGGDQRYYSPELAGYIMGASTAVDKSPEVPTFSSDVFALGLIAHLFLTGEEVSSKSAGYPWQSALDGLTTSAALPKQVSEILQKCLSLEPSKRMRNAREVFDAFKEIQSAFRNGVIPDWTHGTSSIPVTKSKSKPEIRIRGKRIALEDSESGGIATDTTLPSSSELEKELKSGIAIRVGKRLKSATSSEPPLPISTDEIEEKPIVEIRIGRGLDGTRPSSSDGT